MKEVLNINLGQCGIQIAGTFWEDFLKSLNPKGDQPRISTEAAQSFFTSPDNVDIFNDEDENETVPIDALAARCILIDAETGTISEILQRKHINRIDSKNIICGTEATGGNWTTAYYEYGSHYHHAIEERILKQMESSESGLEYVNVTFAIASGTGSGLGSYLLEMLNDDYPKVRRNSCIITQDGVAAVSPYNATLGLRSINEMSHLVTIFSNDALLNQTAQSTPQILRGNTKTEKNQEAGFKSINALISRHLREFGMATVSKRFPCFNINAVINAVTPFRSLNLTCPAMVPEQFVNNGDTMEALTTELLKPLNRLSPVPMTSKGRPIAMAIQGEFDSASLKYIKRLKLKQNMVGWMRDNVKLSIPSSFASERSSVDKGMHAIVNDSAISLFLNTSTSNFDSLYSKKAFLHHFTKLLDQEELIDARDHVATLQGYYDEIYTSSVPPKELLNPESLSSIGASLTDKRNTEYTDIWTTLPSSIDTAKPYWWELNGSPIV
ncbi:tubulin like protein [Babesia gibsoni]|uniref:Tubulin like protein n=1 Tax=Babesia gibsoni TaxID=33632 RepID=A0AAD8PE93_BABGI|nr:tubulin like protein [Babesia gibsoni]